MLQPARFFLILFLLSTFYFLPSVAKPISAQVQNAPVNSYATSNTNVDVPQNLHTWTQNVMIEVISSLTCQLTGVDPISKDHKCLGVDSKTGKIGFVERGGGAVAVMGNLIAQTYRPPLHTSDYFAYLGQNFGIAKKAYAQGVGFNGLSPLAGLWTAFRNITYLLFVIVFVVIGFAIMLRIKIDPRTVMSIENQIPKIIIGIILVTFSFAIAGFVIDMMYVTMYVSYNVIASVPDAKVADLNPVKMQGVSPFSAVEGIGGINHFVNSAAVSTKDTFNSLLGVSPLNPSDNGKGLIDAGIDLPPKELGARFKVKFPDLFPTSSPMDILYNFISAIGGVSMAVKAASITQSAVGTNALGALIGFPIGYKATQALLREGLPWIIPYLIIFIAVLFALFKLWMQLIIAYVYVLLDVVLAPFWIVAGVFPGSPIGFGPWMREIVANLSAFPVTIIMFLLGKVFIDAFEKTPASEQFVPPLIGNPGSQHLIGSLIGIGIILMTPMVVTITRDLFKPPPFKYSAAIGQGIGVGAGAINLPSHMMKIGMLSYYGKNLPRGLRNSRLLKPFLGDGPSAAQG